MARIARGRWTHTHEGDLTVFLIGMRINRPWRPDAWLPVFLAMPRMLRELATDPASGFLGHRLAMGPDGPLVVQYWRRPEDLYRYATDTGAGHRPAWTAFNRRARRVPGAVGIWHETYRVRAGEYETIYTDLPRIGLALAGSHGPLGSTSTAAIRSGVRAQDEAPVPLP